MGDQTLIQHGCAVAVENRGLLILGRSGAGKSALALTLMSLGADLVADDRVLLRRHGTRLIAMPPETLAGLVEARGVGILRADYVAETQLSLVVDMDQLETERLPRHFKIEILDVALPLLRRCDAAHFAPALIQYLKGGVLDPDGQV